MTLDPYTCTVTHLVVHILSPHQEYTVDEAEKAALLAAAFEKVNNAEENNAEEVDDGAEEDIGELLKGKDATITTLRTKLASEIEERAADAKKLAALENSIAALEIKFAALEVKFRAAEERARASEERANKMKDIALLLMG